jgi:cytochrome c
MARRVHHLPLPVTITTRGQFLVAALALAAACSAPGDSDAAVANLVGGDPERGRVLLRTYGCQSCHTIPGVDGANGLVGPPLAGIASRSYIAGVLPNAPTNMLRWIADPKGVDSLTAMPNVGVTPSDARHITAYLYTLR